MVIDRAERSQFDRLQELGSRAVAGGPLACLALAGRRFHGLRDRPWEARRGNIHLSVALPIDAELADLGPGLSMLPAVVVVDALKELIGARLVPGIKWVNDLLVDHAKLCGVLTASRIQGSRVESAVFGIGLNLKRAPEIEPTVFVPKTTCLADHLGGDTPPAHATITALLKAIGTRHRQLLDHGPGPLLSAYREHSLIIGRPVRIWPEEGGPPDPPSATGLVTAIDPDLSLRLRGRVEPVTRGRLALS